MKSHLFHWQGIDKNNIRVKGSCLARNKNDLKQQLLKRHILLCNARQDLFARKLSNQEVTFFLDQMLTFLKAGVPILATLEMIRDNQKSHRIAGRIDDIKNKIEAGAQLSESLMCQVPDTEKVMLEILTVGERSGHLIEVLERLTHQRQRERQIRGRLKRAMIYPLFLIITSATVIFSLIVWVVPEFKHSYESMGAPLPDYTMATIRLSSIIKTYGMTIVGGLLLLGASIGALKRTVPYIQWLISNLQLRIPLSGKLLNEYLCRHFAGNMRLVYHAGIPLEEALAWFAKSGIQPVYCSALGTIRQAICRGKHLHHAIRESKFFPEYVCQIIQAGEHSGTLDQALEKIEQHYDEKLMNSAATMMQLVEPVLIAVIAICIGWLIMSIYLPIFNLGVIL